MHGRTLEAGAEHVYKSIPRLVRALRLLRPLWRGGLEGGVIGALGCAWSSRRKSGCEDHLTFIVTSLKRCIIPDLQPYWKARMPDT